MDLLGDVPGKWHGRNVDPLDAGEREQIGAGDRVWLTDDLIAETDVEDELIEGASGDLSAHVESDRGELVTIAEIVGPHGGKREEVVERELLRRGYVIYRRGLVVAATEVDVLGRARDNAESKVQCECAFEYPAVRCHDDKSPKSSKADSVAQSRECETGLIGFVLEPLIRVPHRVAAWTAARSCCLRRRLASASSSRSVTSPRRSAWLTAIDACSGWISLATSISVRAGVVSGRPSRQTAAIVSLSGWV
jgi:hypothetical protein